MFMMVLSSKHAGETLASVRSPSSILVVCMQLDKGLFKNVLRVGHSLNVSGCFPMNC